MRWWAARHAAGVGRQSRTVAHCASWQPQGFGAMRWSVAQLCEACRSACCRSSSSPLRIGTQHPGARGQRGSVLRVLRDSLFSGRGGSNLLLPRTDLGTLFPDTAAQWLQTRGAALHTGQRVAGLARTAGMAGTWTAHALTRWCWPPQHGSSPPGKRPTAAFPNRTRRSRRVDPCKPRHCGSHPSVRCTHRPLPPAARMGLSPPRKVAIP